MNRPKPTVLVTGASGYIGGFLCRHFAREGFKVVATTRDPSAELADQLEVPEVQKFDLLSGDPMPDGGAADCVVHAATANDILSQDFEDGVRLSLFGTHNLIQKALAVGVRRFLFFSTFQVYGGNLQGEFDDSSPVECANGYGLNHSFGEQLCKLFTRQHPGFETVALRPANIYGCPVTPGVERSTLVPMCFVKQIVEEGQIVVRSSGRQRRNFVSLRQVFNSCRDAVCAESLNGVAVYNIASGWCPTIREIAELTAHVAGEVMGKKIPLKFLSDEPKEPNNFTVSGRFCHSEESGAEEMASEVRKLIDYFSGRVTASR